MIGKLEDAMDLEAIEGVRDLVLRYADAINLYDTDQFGDVFAEDGVWDVQGYYKVSGRASVRDMFIDVRGRFDWVYQVVHGTRVLSVEKDSARARSYVVEYGNLRGNGYFFLASYQDECVRQDGVWRFAYRTCDPLYVGLPDLSAPLKAYPAPKRL